MQLIPDSNTYGFGSPQWLIGQAIPHAPQENKDNTLRTLIDLLLNSQHEYTNRELVDLIAQGVLTGVYRPTMDYSAAFSTPEVEPATDGGYPEHDNPDNPLSAIDEEEIRRFTERMENWATGEDPDLPPSGKPEGWDYLDE